MVFHTAALAYLPDPADRAAFASTVRSLNATWIANEAPGFLSTQPPEHAWPAGFDPFLLTRDSEPIAWVDPHGTSIDWLESQGS